MSWRYQPVTFSESSKGENCVVYQLVEVYFDKRGRFTSWTTPPGICPSGEDDPNGLVSDLCHMLMDAQCWEPVKFEDLKPGMKFKRMVTMKQRQALATMIENVGHNLAQAKVRQSNG